MNLNLSRFALLFLSIFILFNSNVFAQDSLNITRTSLYSNSWFANDIAVNGNYAYATAGSELRVVDVSDSTSPIDVGKCYVTSNNVNNVVVNDRYAFVTDYYGGLYAVDIQDPFHPTLFYTMLYPATGWYNALSIVVRDTILYVVGSNVDGMRILGVNDPSHYSSLSNYNTNSNGDRVVLSGSHAYVRFGIFFTIVDVSNPRNPRTSGVHAFDDGNHNDYRYTVNNGYLFYPSFRHFEIWDVRDPATMDLLTSDTCFQDQDIYSVEATDNYLYAVGDMWPYYGKTGSINGGPPAELKTIDISNLAHPRIIHRTQISYGGGDSGGFVRLTGNRLYIYACDATFMVFSYANPAAPVRTCLYDKGSFTDIAISSTYAYLLSNFGIRVVDISNPSAPRDTTTTAFTGFNNDSYSGKIVLDNGMAYVLCIYDGIYQFSLDNPVHPRLISHLSANITDFAVRNSIVYYQTLDNGFKIIDWHNPEAPLRLSLTDSLDGDKLLLDGNRAFISTWAGKISILDISNNHHLVFLGQFTTTQFSNGPLVAVSGNTLYTACWYHTLLAWDISNPSAVTQVFIDTTTFPNYCSFYQMKVQGQRLFMSGYGCGLTVFDISNPTQPRRSGYYHEDSEYYQWGNSHITVAGSCAYQTNGSSLSIYDLSYLDGAPEPKPVVNPVIFALKQNYPNPFNATTTISFSLPHAGNAKLELYNSNGQLVKTLVSDWLTAGEHRVMWNAQQMPSGVYFARYRVGAEQRTVKMLLVK